MRTVVLLMGAVAISVLGFAGLAGAQQSYPPSGVCSLSVGSAVATAGQTITVKTDDCNGGYAPGGPVDLTFKSTPVSLGTVNADANGQLSAVTIPSDASLGDHTIRANGARPDGSTLVLSTGITVVGPRNAGSAGALPFTGSSNVLPAVWIALAALVVGSALVIGVRRRATVRSQQDVSNS